MKAFRFDPRTHARSSDPQTSSKAAVAAKEFAPTHAGKILAALENGPGTQSSISKQTGLLPHQVNKRLADLAQQGKIVTTGKTLPGHANKEEREWKLAKVSSE